MSENEVDVALGAPIEERATRLAELPEDQWFDRKSVRIDPKTLAKALVAFANAEGGTIVIGLNDGEVEGVKRHASHVNALRQASIDFTVPPVRMHADQVGVRRADGSTDALLLLRIPPSEGVHETHTGDCYLRIGDESRKLTQTLRTQLEYDRGVSVYDGTRVAGSIQQDLDQAALSAYRQAARAQSTYQRLLQARSLLTREGELTVAAWLLFAALPQSTMPHAHVRVMQYGSIERGTGSRHSVISGKDIRVEGRIPDVIMEAARLVDEWLPSRDALSADGRFEPIPIVPRDAWLEGIVNAVVHRAYSIVGDHVRVEIFPNRIEIESPGRFPGLVDPKNLDGISRYARNPRIARVCADLSIGRELGEGIRRMVDEMRLAGLTDPVFTQTQASVKLTLAADARIPAAVADRLPRNAESVLNALRRSRRPLGTGEVQEALGWARPTVVRHLRALRDEGLVAWRGQSEKDPRATWEIAFD
ncbi:helix-turn-helix domain-containing protein [Agrococcus sediminis]|uniref:Helix-turn-helix domain-containing protein n=1 Tax=Agrococcus sediminis TaxID=2599924 RepID=A0A5M8QL72_9MICO|nr:MULTISPECIES: ATP-binding protein [Agrococcus]KAA6435978.1 helix-turn-helix domain-containing protein [Agrococcus sediminis]UOW01847.1 putative DNA binding domain-containing protein [Agrococcus sp. SCSIO52902]